MVRGPWHTENIPTNKSKNPTTAGTHPASPKTIFPCSRAPDNPMPSKIPYRLIAMTSSKLAAARMTVETPLSSPYPWAFSLSIQGTTTAGETAAMKAPRAKAKCQGMSQNHMPSRPIIVPSVLWGIKVNKIVERPIFFKDFKSSSKPARSKITVKAILLISCEMISCM